MSNNMRKSIILVLILAILGVSYYSYQNNKNHKLIEKELLLEKETLIKDLSNLEQQFDEAISKNTLLSNDLEKQKNSITSFKDSLKTVKKTNRKLINFYKNKIKNLGFTTRKFIKANDSLVEINTLLNLENQGLTVQKDSLTSNMQNQTEYTKTLVEQNLNLAKKVALGEVVTVNNFNVTTYRETNSGKFIETDRARRVDVFKSNFVLNENPIAKKSDIVAHIVIYKPNGKLLLNKGTFTNCKGNDINYSDTSTIPYKKVTVTSEIFTKFGEIKLEKGKYIIEFYINNCKVGTVAKNLR